MEVHLPWGGSTLTLRVPGGWRLQFPEGTKEPGEGNTAPADERKAIRSALAKPADSERLADMDLAGKKVVLIVDDNTRPTPAHRFMDILLDELAAGGAAMEDVLLVPALGIHTPMTQEEMAAKVGQENLARIRWENHDAFDREANHLFGTTSRGTPVLLNRHLKDAGLVVLVGMVEPHLWAGFGGGWKNVLPGVAHAEAIAAHHGVIAEPPYLFNRVGMTPEDNLFRTELEEVATMLPSPVFCLNVVLGHDQRVAGAFAGDPVACHRNAVAFNRRLSGRHMDGPVDAVITNSFPMDINLKQGMKCVGNALPALKPRGVVMGFIRAERGVDDVSLPEDSRPLWLVKALLRTLGPSRVFGLLERIKKGLNVEEKFLAYYTMQLMRRNDLYLCIPTLSPDEVKRLGFFRHSSDPQAVVDMAARKLPRNARIAVFPEGGATFPILR